MREYHFCNSSGSSMTGVPFDKDEGHQKLVQCFNGLPPAPGARLWRNSVGYTPTTRKVAGIRVGLTAILPVVILRHSRVRTSNTWLDQHETCRCMYSY